jgi:serine phosphatase RsbU (regulator of sigma subunit)
MMHAPAPQHNLESLRRTVQSLTVELLTVYEELELLYSVGAQIGRLADENQIAAVALKEAMEILSADCGWVALLDDEALRVPECCRIGIQVETMDHINRAVLESLYHQGKREFVSHALNEEYKLVQKDAPSRFLAASLAVEGNSRGFVCLGRHETGSSFLSPDQKLIRALALLMAVELENVRLQRSELEKQRLVNELELARTIQQSLLPRNFSCTDFLDAAGVSEPCYEVGGDFFDLIPINAGLCMLVIADVSGKGPPAALQAAMVQGIVHATSRNSPELSLLMGTLNECILSRPVEDHFVTAFAATLDSAGRLRYSNGGHTRPLWIRTDGQVTELAEGGPLLGVFDKASYSQGSVQLESGDLLLLFTDGVTEAEDPQGNPFGTARLLDWAHGQAGQSPAEVKKSLLGTIWQFSAGKRQSDDMTILVVGYTGRLVQQKSP